MNKLTDYHALILAKYLSKHARETIQIHCIPSKFPLPTHLTNLLSVNILSIS